MGFCFCLARVMLSCFIFFISLVLSLCIFFLFPFTSSPDSHLAASSCVLHFFFQLHPRPRQFLFPLCCLTSTPTPTPSYQALSLPSETSGILSPPLMFTPILSLLPSVFPPASVSCKTTTWTCFWRVRREIERGRTRSPATPSELLLFESSARTRFPP